MLSKNLQKEVVKFDYMLDMIFGIKTRYNISLITSPSKIIFISFEDDSTNEFIFKTMVETTNQEYIHFINKLRNSFIEHGVLVSKLNRTDGTGDLIYDSQELFVKNISMKVNISSPREQLEAVIAHGQVLVPNIQQAKLFKKN